MRKRDTGSADELRRLGMDIYEPTPVELAEWTAAVRKPYDKWKAAISPALATKLEQVTASAKR